jgi:hypothetical protein
MNQMMAIKKVTLTDKHLRPGRAKHQLKDSSGLRDFPPLTHLTITTYPDEQSGFYLMNHCSDGLGTDTLHETLEEALEQAEWEFEVKPEEWTDTNEPF